MKPKRHLPEFAHSLFRKFEDEGINLLLAGGWAVCFHGYSRATIDVDWICRRSQSGAACQLMEKLGFVRLTEGMASRFRHSVDAAIPFADFIWVDDPTFEAMADEAQNSPPPLSVRMLGFRSLLAMKLFALKDGEARDHKDLLDIRSLIRYSPTQISDDELRGLCERYASASAFDKVKGMP